MWEKTAMWEKAILMVGRRLEAGEFAAAGRQPLPKRENGSTILLSNHPVLDPLTAPFYSFLPCNGECERSGVL
jgi:hypothetical protein